MLQVSVWYIKNYVHIPNLLNQGYVGKENADKFQLASEKDSYKHIHTQTTNVPLELLFTMVSCFWQCFGE